MATGPASNTADFKELAHKVSLLVYYTEDFEIDTDQIGQGSFGIVYRAWHKKHKRWYAIKTSNSANVTDEETTKSVLQEVTQMVAVRDRYILQVYGMVANDNELVGIVMEYMPYGSIYKIANKGIIFPTCLKLRFIYETAQAMNMLHSNNILHLDIKSPNILLDEDLRVKLTDFGLSVKFRDTVNRLSKEIEGPDQVRKGTVSFIAPEVFTNLNTKRNKKLDIYAFGITIWEILTGKWPFDGCTEAMVIFGVRERQRPDLSEIPTVTENEYQSNKIIVQLMKKCWHQDPQERPEFAEILDQLQPLMAESERDAIKEVPQIKEKLTSPLPLGQSDQKSQGTDTATSLVQGLQNLQVMSKALGGDSTFAKTTGRMRMPASMVAASVFEGECHIAMQSTIPQLDLREDAPPVQRQSSTGQQGEGVQQPEDFHFPSGVFSAAPPSVDTNITHELDEISDGFISKLAPEIVDQWNDFAQHLRLSNTELEYVKSADGMVNQEVVWLGLTLWKRRFGKKAIRKWILAIFVHMKLYNLIPLLRDN